MTSTYAQKWIEIANSTRICTFGRDKVLQELCEFSGWIHFNVRTILIPESLASIVRCSYLKLKSIRLSASQNCTSSIYRVRQIYYAQFICAEVTGLTQIKRVNSFQSIQTQLTRITPVNKLGVKDRFISLWFHVMRRNSLMMFETRSFERAQDSPHFLCFDNNFFFQITV